MTDILYHRRYHIVVELEVVQSQTTSKRRNPQRSNGIEQAHEPHRWLGGRLSIRNRVTDQWPGVPPPKLDGVRPVRLVVSIARLVQNVHILTDLMSLVVIQFQPPAIDNAVVVD